MANLANQQFLANLQQQLQIRNTLNALNAATQPKSSSTVLWSSSKPPKSTPAPAAPAPMQTHTQTNPQLQSLLGEYKQYQGGLAAGSDIDATLALQRQRDLTSGMAAEAEQGAIARTGVGGVSETARGNVLQAGTRGMSGLQAQLASDARSKQLAALQGRGQLELGQAGATQAQQQFGLSQWQAQQQAAQAQAQLAAMQQQNQFSNQMALANMYTGF